MALFIGGNTVAVEEILVRGLRLFKNVIPIV